MKHAGLGATLHRNFSEQLQKIGTCVCVYMSFPSPFGLCVPFSHKHDSDIFLYVVSDKQLAIILNTRTTRGSIPELGFNDIFVSKLS